jgi:hypothetical protein
MCKIKGLSVSYKPNQTSILVCHQHQFRKAAIYLWVYFFSDNLLDCRRVDRKI